MDKDIIHKDTDLKDRLFSGKQFAGWPQPECGQ